MQKKLITFLICIFVFSPFLLLNASQGALSWKDIGMRSTNEDQLVKFAGHPTSIILLPEDYVQMKNCEYPKNQIFEYYGYLGKNENPILFNKTPLSISNEVISIKAIFAFQSGIVKTYSYEFGMHPVNSISKEKYLNIFKVILGEPIRYTENSGIFIYYYKNNLTLWFLPDSPALFKILLEFNPNNN